jgi:hypothetical protein
VDLPVGFLIGLAQGFQEQPTVGVIHENSLTPIAAIHDVVNRARILNSEFARHPAHQLWVWEEVSQV